MSTLLGGKSTKVNDIPVYEGYDVEVNGDLILLQESYDDQLAIIESIHAMDSADMEFEAEFAKLHESSASEYELESLSNEYSEVMEATAAGVWVSIKNFFRRMMAKLRAFFDSVMRYFNGLFMSAQKFAAKYESQLKKLESSGKLNGYKYERYNYTHLDEPLVKIANPGGTQANKLLEELIKEVDRAKSVGSDDVKNLQQFAQDYNNNKEGIAAQYRKVVARASSPLDADELGPALWSLFRDGAKNKEDKKEIDVRIDDVLKTIKNTEAKKAVKDAHDAAIKELNDTIKVVDKAADEFEKVDGDRISSAPSSLSPENKSKHIANKRSAVVGALRAVSQMTTLIRDVELTVHREWRSAWAERDSTFKKICVKAFSYKAEK